MKSLRSFLTEGGNAISNAQPFDHVKIPEIMKQVKAVLPDGVNIYPIGSGATPTPGKISGDLDVIVDLDEILSAYGVTTAKEARNAIKMDLEDKGLEVGQSGVSVHFGATVDGVVHQVDIMVVENGKRAAGFHTHNVPAGSKYKGSHKVMAIAALAKFNGLMWSPYEGLYVRDAETGKKKGLLSNDLDEISRILIGPNADKSDLGSYESILSAIKEQDPERAQELEDYLAQSPNFVKAIRTDV